jgi:hypothetical protein
MKRLEISDPKKNNEGSTLTADSDLQSAAAALAHQVRKKVERLEVGT